MKSNCIRHNEVLTMIRRSGLLAEKSNYPNGEPKYSPHKIEGQKELSFPCKMFISDLLD